MNDNTPIIGFNDIFVKKDCDFFKGGVCGTRGRMIYTIMERLHNANYKQVVYACGREDVDLALVAVASDEFAMQRCDIFTPTGEKTVVMNCMEVVNDRVTYHQVPNGYSNVLNARARDFSFGDSDRVMIPMGFVCRVAVETVMHQCTAIPKDVRRIVVYDESGVTVAGIMAGLSYYGRSDISVLGITSKSEPYGVIARIFGVGILDKPSVNMQYNRVGRVTVNDEVDYAGIKLHTQSDARCVKYLDKGDMLWVCGNKVF